MNGVGPAFWPMMAIVVSSACVAFVTGTKKVKMAVMMRKNESLFIEDFRDCWRVERVTCERVESREISADADLLLESKSAHALGASPFERGNR